MRCFTVRHPRHLLINPHGNRQTFIDDFVQGITADATIGMPSLLFDSGPAPTRKIVN
jgi:hypothetical protein